MLDYPGPHERRLSRPRSSAELWYSMMGVDEVLLQDYTPFIPLLILMLIRVYLGAG